MFTQGIIVAIIIGYALKGRLKNFQRVDLKGVYLVVVSFTVEFLVISLIRKNIINQGIITYLIDLFMYLVLFYFVYLNKKDPFILMIGFGSLLNAIPIFLNGGSMPVSHGAAIKAGYMMDITKMGLYNLINSNTKFWILGDIFPYKFIISFVMSIGDIIIELGLMLFIITGMKNKEITSNVSDKIV